MSSHHRNLAAVWDHLQGRNDISGTLREVIGQHALQHTFRGDEAQTSGENYETIIWIKIIYDLQRCYLSGITTGTTEIPSQILPCLLPHELLFSSILYLINTKVRTFPSQTTLMTKEFTRPRLILVQTILSGLRLLLLHKDHVSLHQKRSLQAAINEAWRDDHLRGVECCMVQQVFAAMLDVMNESDHVDAYRVERENARLPTYTSGLVRPCNTFRSTTDVRSISWI